MNIITHFITVKTGQQGIKNFWVNLLLESHKGEHCIPCLTDLMLHTKVQSNTITLYPQVVSSIFGVAFNISLCPENGLRPGHHISHTRITLWVSEMKVNKGKIGILVQWRLCIPAEFLRGNYTESSKYNKIDCNAFLRS